MKIIRYDFLGAMYPEDVEGSFTPIIMERVAEFRDGMFSTDKATYNWTKSQLSKIINNFITWSCVEFNSKFLGKYRTDELLVLGNVRFFAKLLDIKGVKDHFRVYLKSFKEREKKIIPKIFAELPKHYYLDANEKNAIVELTKLLLEK